jgi:hypothetical protein
LSGVHRKERGESRGIYAAIVHDLDFMPLSPAAKLLWYTLRLELGLSGIGVMYPAMLPEPTGLSMFDVDAGLQELCVTQWLVRERNVMWLRNALRFDPYVNMKGRVHVQSVVTHLGGLPRLKIVGDFCAYYGIDPAWLDSGVPEKFTPPPRERLYHWVSATPTDTPKPTPPLQELGVRSKELGSRSEEKNTSAASQPPVGAPKKKSVELTPDDPAVWMHAVWQEELGVAGHPTRLNKERVQKYRAMYEENLSADAQPEMAWRAVLWAVKQSDFHMTKREYQMPESILTNESRRERWVMTARELLQDGGQSQQQRDVIKIREYLRRSEA